MLDYEPPKPQKPPPTRRWAMWCLELGVVLCVISVTMSVMIPFVPTAPWHRPPPWYVKHSPTIFVAAGASLVIVAIGLWVKATIDDD